MMFSEQTQALIDAAAAARDGAVEARKTARTDSDAATAAAAKAGSSMAESEKAIDYAGKTRQDALDAIEKELSIPEEMVASAYARTATAKKK